MTRLTEHEVHQACLDISAQGERPTSLTLLKKLGRGSLTTITKYLNSWKDTDEALNLKADLLPPVAELPEALSLSAEELAKKIWLTSKEMADKELEIQREALKQTEIENQAIVEEAFEFSEAQTTKIEWLEEELKQSQQQLKQKTTDYDEALTQLNVTEKNNVALLKDNEWLTDEVSVLQAKLLELESLAKDNRQKLLTTEKQLSKLEGKLEVYTLMDKGKSIKK